MVDVIQSPETPQRITIPITLSAHDCNNCGGKFCCHSLRIGEPLNKPPLIPCAALDRNGSCTIHKEIQARVPGTEKLPCAGYFCGDAGPTVTQLCIIAGHPEWAETPRQVSVSEAGEHTKKQLDNPAHFCFNYLYGGFQHMYDLQESLSDPDISDERKRIMRNALSEGKEATESFLNSKLIPLLKKYPTQKEVLLGKLQDFELSMRKREIVTKMRLSNV